jgi:hypothetical protein
MTVLIFPKITRAKRSPPQFEKNYAPPIYWIVAKGPERDYAQFLAQWFSCIAQAKVALDQCCKFDVKFRTRFARLEEFGFDLGCGAVSTCPPTP